jgi:hypothetical protein
MSRTVLRPKFQPRESILLFAKGGAGKSTAVLQIASEVEGQLYAIDNDYAPSYDVLLGLEFPDLADSGRVTVEHIDPEEFTRVVTQIEEWTKIAGRDDWLSVDSMTPTWQSVQGEYSQGVHGKDLAELFMDARKKQIKTNAKVMGALDGDTDWNVINRMYMELYAAIAKWPGHVVLCADEKAIGEKDTRDSGDKDLYSGGFRPEGQKRFVNGHVSRTILRIAKYKNDPKRRLIMIKDRGREKLWDRDTEGWLPYTDLEDGGFAYDYLAGIGGWAPVTVNQ